MKITFIATVYNEEKTIGEFLTSLIEQSMFPDEVILVDAKSTDKTNEIVRQYESRFKKKKISFLLFNKKGNRSIGRNEAIQHATGDIIIASDAGCVLDKNWVMEIAKPFNNKKIDVVAGYYHPVTKTIFEKCMAAYTSIMPDKVDPDTFLPSSRSIGFRKTVWEKVYGYPENLDTCEDLVFARTAKQKGFHFSFAKNAIVYWPQRATLKEAFLQFFSYALGDGQAWYIRPQTPLLFFRYIIGVILVVFYFRTHSHKILATLFLLLILYIIWAIKKNYRYVKDWQAFYLLPILQFTADVAVLSGFTIGSIDKYGI
ncbi:MAG TPA: glycosyltransferase [Candidatus Sulfotelmatobacter sp.]|jgi:glycosyltransferase involved in cell wall biosynthesis|nr:glycosyltransferase [Candidatus Sulfotelmatobacter sp.]